MAVNFICMFFVIAYFHCLVRLKYVSDEMNEWMAKIKSSKSALLKMYVSKFDNIIISSGGIILICKIGKVQVCADRWYAIPI